MSTGFSAIWEQQRDLASDANIHLAEHIAEAEAKAIDALSRYKFAMFGYWAGIWVHLNKIEGNKRPSPFRDFVHLARSKN